MASSASPPSRASMAAAGMSAPRDSRPTCPTTGWSTPSVPSSNPRPDAVAPAVLLVDKPAGPTSHDIVARVKRERGQKTGHAGTLDPFATGLLIVLCGREATREQARFMSLRKTYRVTARFGATSSTGDRDGEITETG